MNQLSSGVPASASAAQSRTWRARAVVLLACFAIGFLGTTLWRHWGRTEPTAAPGPQAAAGTQVLFVYIGSSTCGPSNLPQAIAAVDEARDRLRTTLESKGLQLVTLGVARELSVQHGLDHLAKFDPFHEVSAGQRELNQASLRFLSRDHPGVLATPQIVVVERVLVSEGIGVNTSRFTERVLLRKVGADEIVRWVAMGAPLPSDLASSLSAVPFP